MRVLPEIQLQYFISTAGFFLLHHYYIQLIWSNTLFDLVVHILVASVYICFSFIKIHIFYHYISTTNYIDHIDICSLEKNRAVWWKRSYRIWELWKNIRDNDLNKKKRIKFLIAIDFNQSHHFFGSNTPIINHYFLNAASIIVIIF